ncbi:alpha/beta hydrolase [Cellulomonas timonensis]|uniref:alpha/beta hydrolase n=1 Tax=Cellulomonas timonensis TaxID=1689271 RepID=UPI0009EF48CA|nr:alpha/beta hydrolase [Cellulomonas timonensis]
MSDRAAPDHAVPDHTVPDDALAADGTSPVPDVLGDGWTAQTLRLRPEAGGTPVATLVHRVPDPGAPPSRRAVLYVHGFVDYFFQRHVGDAFAAHGDDFYALDLRGYGRSLLPWQEPNYVTDLSMYCEELDAAARVLLASHDEIVLMGHSTGGLIAALWADARRDAGVVDAVVLNSPWLDLRGSWLERVVATPLIDVVGQFAPRLKVGRLGGHYGPALHVGTGGEWDYNLAWKPHAGFPVRAGWLRTVRRGHARVARGLGIACPVLVLASDASGPDDRWHDALLSTDSVLDVAQIAARSVGLGPDVAFVEVPGGTHDLALSAEPARTRYLREALDWLDARLPR